MNYKQFIQFKIMKKSRLVSWVTDVYASPAPCSRRFLWDLERFASNMQNHWLVGGDFNSILYVLEKQWGSTRSSGVCALFKDWFDK